MSVQFGLLGIINLRPTYGYELKKTYDELFGTSKNILYGQIYSTLTRLQRDRKITDLPTREKDGGPERIQYDITAEGEKALRNWLATPEGDASSLQPTLYMKVVLALMNDNDPDHYLDIQRRSYLQQMRTLVARRSSVGIAEKALLDHTILHIEADLKWIDHTSRRLKKLKEEICRR